MDFSQIWNYDRQIYFAYGVLGLKNVETQLHKKISKLPSNKTSTRNIFRFYSTWGQNSKTRLKDGIPTTSPDRGFHHMTKNRRETWQIVRLITGSATRLRNSSRGHFTTSPMWALSHTYYMDIIQRLAWRINCNEPYQWCITFFCSHQVTNWHWQQLLGIISSPLFKNNVWIHHVYYQRVKKA